MAAPDGFTVVRRRELECGPLLVACKDDRQAIHLELPDGPFTRGEAATIAESLIFAYHECLPRMFSDEEQARREARAI